MSAWAVRRSSSSTYGCRCRRCVRTAGRTCSPARDIKGEAQPRLPFDPLRIRRTER